MRHIRALAVAVTLVLAGAASAQGWAEYLDRERVFVVILPGEAQAETRDPGDCVMHRNHSTRSPGPGSRSAWPGCLRFCNVKDI